MSSVTEAFYRGGLKERMFARWRARSAAGEALEPLARTRTRLMLSRWQRRCEASRAREQTAVQFHRRTVLMRTLPRFGALREMPRSGGEVGEEVALVIAALNGPVLLREPRAMRMRRDLAPFV